MKVTILGTGSIYSKSNCASLIIDNNILVDIGPGVVKELLKLEYDLLKIDTILITHLHGDHISDFPTFIVNIGVLGINHKINIYSPKGTKDKFLALLNITYGDEFDGLVNQYLNFVEISDNDFLTINDHKVKVKKVSHAGMESYGFIVDSKLGITGDASICNGVKQIFDESKVTVCDCSLINGDIYHMGIDNIVELLKDNNDKKVVLTHFRDTTREFAKRMNFNNVLIAEDGYKFLLES